MITFYGYNKCSTCRNAKKWLAAKGLAIKEIDISASPPPRSTIKAIIQAGGYRLAELFNRSGRVYRQLNMKDKIKTMGEAELIDLLTGEGMLVKRPVVTDGARHTVGFDPRVFEEVWSPVSAGR